MFHKKSFLLLLIVLLSVSFVSAYYLKYPYYMGTGETESIRVYGDTSVLNYSIISFNGSDYNMTDSVTYWNIYVSSGVEENQNFSIYLSNQTINKTDNNTYLLNVNGTMRFRSPFYVTITLYESGNNETTYSALYKNEFQYLFLQPRNTLSGSSWMDSELITFSFMDKWLGKLFDYEVPTTIDTSLSFWGKYDTGSTQIKLYEPGNYSMNLESIKVTGSDLWDEEFIYPQYTESQFYNEILLLNIDKINQSIDIFIDRFEISSFRFTMNIVWNLLVWFIWLVLVIVVGLVSKDVRGTLVVAVVLGAIAGYVSIGII